MALARVPLRLARVVVVAATLPFHVATSENVSHAFKAAATLLHFRSASTGGSKATSPASLFIGNVPEGATSKEIWDYFSQFGIIKKNGVHVHPQQNPPSFGFVHFLHEEAVENALKAPPLVIYDHVIRVERRLHGYDAAVFTHDRPVYRELVLSLYRKHHTNELCVGIHGYWFCNVLSATKIVTLKNKDQIDEKLERQIEEIVKTEVKAMGQGNVMLWKPRGKRASATKHLTYQTKIHNVYQGEIYYENLIKEATQIATPYTSPSGPQSLVTCFQLFKENLDKVIETGVEKHALDLFGKFAKFYYGRNVRITMKAHQIDIGFLSDENNPVDHILTTPKGSSQDFYQFCHA